jgi:predicted enzyme related to lactoylglutathione lyase
VRLRWSVNDHQFAGRLEVLPLPPSFDASPCCGPTDGTLRTRVASFYLSQSINDRRVPLRCDVYEIDDAKGSTLMSTTESTATDTNIVKLASIRIIAEDMEPLVRFYEILTGAVAQWLTNDFVELVTPSATVAISHSSRVSFLGDGSPRAAANNTTIYEFLVEDVEALLMKLQAELGDDLTIAQGLTMMPWGNMSLLIRDPDGALINLYTPVTPDAVKLQEQRQPQLPKRQADS